MDAPLWLRLEMETLVLLFHSLWILQCNTASADSIIHIGEELLLVFTFYFIYFSGVFFVFLCRAAGLLGGELTLVR